MIFKNSDVGRAREGFAAEQNDCTVRAAAIRFTTSYTRAHELLKEIGREPGRGINSRILKNLFDKMGLELRKPLFKITLGQFIKQNPKGRFFVVVRAHAVGISDGVCIDTLPPRLRMKVWWYA